MSAAICFAEDPRPVFVADKRRVLRTVRPGGS
jgi:hypothetical protein